MFRRIGTRALKCEHGKLLGVQFCNNCELYLESATGRRVALSKKPVTSPMQEIGMHLQSAFERLEISIHDRLKFFPVWAGTMEDMSDGKMVFGLQTGHPREDYENPKLQLVVSMKIKHTSPWYSRLWGWITRRRPKPWDQQRGYHFRSDGKGNVRKVKDPDHKFVVHAGPACPRCQGVDIADHSKFEKECGQDSGAYTCNQCGVSWYHRAG